MKKTTLFSLFSLCLTLAMLVSPGHAQEDANRLRILDVDSSTFPTVRLTLLTSDAASAPIADLSGLTLRENGTLISDFSIGAAPVGIDVTFVLDANVGYGEVDDDSGLARAEKVRESIGRFARFYMDSEGRDRVSIVVPDGNGQDGRFLLQDAAVPQEVLDAIAAYDPGALRPTPLNAMISLGLDDLGQRAAADPNRFRTMLLFSDSRRLDEQLSYPLLTPLANDSGTAISVAILGAAADAQEIDNARRLFEPTRGTYVHMPQPVDTDPLYATWQAQGNPPQLVYRSPLRQSGQHQIAVALGPAVASATYDLQLAAPVFTVQPEAVQVRRSGTTPETALAELQPAVWPFVLEVQWPDGLPRRLSSVRLTIDGREQPLDVTLPELPAATLSLSWDMSAQDEGARELLFEITDELGYTAATSVPAEITVQRPLPPTSAPTTTAATDSGQAALNLTLPAWRPEYAALPLGLLGILLFGLVWRRRRRKRQARALQIPVEGRAVLDGTQSGEMEPELLPRLEPLSASMHSAISLTSEMNTIGRVVGPAQIILPDKSVAPLHARIRRRDDTYWLLDEGSANGTFHNYERLGLAPVELRDGDTVQFGTLGYTFRLRTQAEIDVLAREQAPIAIVFDMDGLMVDTEPLAHQAWNEVLGEEGLAPLDEDQYGELIGRRFHETAEYLVGKYELSADPADLAERKNAAFARLRAAYIPVMPGLKELLAELARLHVPWGVATSTPRAVAEDILTQIGVAESCAALAAGDEVVHGKPAPDVYLLAAERLQVAPARCLAFEDTELGCTAAQAAGMVTIAVPAASPEPGAFACATAVLPSLLGFLPQLEGRLSELRQR